MSNHESTPTESPAALDRVLALGASPWRRWLSGPIAALVWAGAAVVMLATPATSGAADTVDPPPALTMVQMEAPPEPPPEPPPPQAPEVAPPLAPMPATPVGPPSPIPIAQASAVETAPEDDNPYDDDDTMVVGTAETYAGGVSGTNGASGGPGGGYGGGGAKAAPPEPPPGPPAPDLTRPAHCPINVDWGCEPLNTHEGALTIVRLLIRGNGTVEEVDVMTAPDGAFRKEAIACSRRQRCDAARDRSGHAITGWTKPVRIRFTY